MTPNPLACYQCGLRYGGPGWCDVVVNDDVWVAISPTGDRGGILCFNCIAARLDDLGMTDVRMLVKSGPFVHDPREKEVKPHHETCPTCDGSGEAMIGKPPASHRIFGRHTPCPTCNGTGQVSECGMMELIGGEGPVLPNLKKVIKPPRPIYGRRKK